MSNSPSRTKKRAASRSPTRDSSSNAHAGSSTPSATPGLVTGAVTRKRARLLPEANDASHDNPISDQETLTLASDNEGEEGSVSDSGSPLTATISGTAGQPKQEQQEDALNQWSASPELQGSIPKQTPQVNATVKTEEREAEISQPDETEAENASPAAEELTPPPSRKKARRDSSSEGAAASEGRQVEAGLKLSPFLTIPIEVFAEILLYTNSSNDVLSVAYTCKSFCQTLLQPSSAFIWKHARLHNAPRPLLDYHAYGFGEVFSEASFAAFALAGGKCEICGENARKPFDSYALRIRLCHKKVCEEALAKNLIVQMNSSSSPLLSILQTHKVPVPVLEDERILLHTPQLHLPVARKVVPPKLLALVNEHSDKPDFAERVAKVKERHDKWMNLCRDLIIWRRTNKTMYYDNKRKNEVIGKAIATELGWNFKDMMNCTAYGLYHRNKNIVFGSISQVDVNALTPQIEHDLMRLEERRDRRLQETLYQENRQQILQHYAHLQSSKQYPVLPSLTAFRQLPVITMLQTTDGEEKTQAEHVSNSLKSDAVLSNMLKTQINTWVGKAKDDLGVVMGEKKKWKSVSKAEVHPAERLSARYKCTRCQVIGNAYAEDGCFDFAGACTHDCSKPKQGKKNKNTWKWESKSFVKDEKASAVIQHYISECKLKDKGLKSVEELGPSLKAFVVCKSCPSPIIMQFQNMIGHSHRHEKMEYSIVEQEDVGAIAGKYMFHRGYTKKLMRSTDQAKKAQDKKVYGCRYCYNKQLEEKKLEDEKKAAAAARGESQTQATDVNAAPGDEAQNVEAVEQEPGIFPAVFTFNGVRSHLKDKHEIPDVRDEDYFCTKGVPDYLVKP
ncbi:hypothetical protein FA15DRAFT_667321 [Coprinopsis marcescibilis]|uniref:F-box domain-containing protein n=1 Tax=Coprinopsis marcescibilis TaxID=230819 RepID=A0A5C3L1M4_COPMA|nr:hypothetical protein FA15DRAFT_667321 [Coprinopsis marcescibilis]